MGHERDGDYAEEQSRKVLALLPFWKTVPFQSYTYLQVSIDFRFAFGERFETHNFGETLLFRYNAKAWERWCNDNGDYKRYSEIKTRISRILAIITNLRGREKRKSKAETRVEERWDTHNFGETARMPMSEGDEGV